VKSFENNVVLALLKTGLKLRKVPEWSRGKGAFWEGHPVEMLIVQNDVSRRRRRCWSGGMDSS